MKSRYLVINTGLATLLACASAHASCGTTACSMNANWDEHSPTQSGWSLDLRYSYFKADTLRSGSKKISADTSRDGEVENIGTTANLITATADYNFDDKWGATLIVPYINRQHDHHLGPYDGDTPAGRENFKANAIGDIKAIGRYRWALGEDHSAGMGVKFGLKLPSGKRNEVNSTGEKPDEVTLQAGNGSTDMILGLFWYETRPGSDWSWFAQGTLQNSINALESYRPGNQFNLDVGTRYSFSHTLSGLLQFNAQRNSSDSREAAALTEDGKPNSGVRTLYFSPGLSYALSRETQVYGIVQLPLYQYVNGEQLTPDWSMTVGLNHRF